MRLGERIGVLESSSGSRSLKFLSSFCFALGYGTSTSPWDLSGSGVSPLPHVVTCSLSHPTLLTHLCILVSWGGKGWVQSEILEEGQRNQGFLVLLLQEKATFSRL